MIPVALLLLAGCKRVDPAPEDLDGLLHFLWDTYEQGSDAEIADATTNLHDVLDGAEEAGDGSVSSLQLDQVREAGLDREVDPSEAVGLYIADPMSCDMDTVEAIVISTEQAVLWRPARPTPGRTPSSA